MAFVPTFSCVSILRWRGPLRFALGVDQRRSSPMEPCGRIDRWVGLQLQLLRWIFDLCKTVWRCLLSNFGFPVSSLGWASKIFRSKIDFSQSWAIHFSSDFSFQWPSIRRSFDGDLFEVIVSENVQPQSISHFPTGGNHWFLGRPVGHQSAIRALCWSPDGGKVLTGSADRRALRCPKHSNLG